MCMIETISVLTPVMIPVLDLISPDDFLMTIEGYYVLLRYAGQSIIQCTTFCYAVRGKGLTNDSKTWKVHIFGMNSRPNKPKLY
jgi:hypothetical protein